MQLQCLRFHVLFLLASRTFLSVFFFTFRVIPGLFYDPEYNPECTVTVSEGYVEPSGPIVML